MKNTLVCFILSIFLFVRFREHFFCTGGLRSQSHPLFVYNWTLCSVFECCAQRDHEKRSSVFHRSSIWSNVQITNCAKFNYRVFQVFRVTVCSHSKNFLIPKNGLCECRWTIHSKILLHVRNFPYENSKWTRFFAKKKSVVKWIITQKLPLFFPEISFFQKINGFEYFKCSCRYIFRFFSLSSTFSDFDYNFNGF